jgi:hypothetical protein
MFPNVFFAALRNYTTRIAHFNPITLNTAKLFSLRFVKYSSHTKSFKERAQILIKYFIPLANSYDIAHV